MARRSNVRPIGYSGAMTTRDEVPMLQLEVLKRIQAELVNLRTDVNSLKDEVSGVKSELTSVKSELKSEIASVRTELTSEIASVRTELSSEIAELRRTTHEGFVRVRTELVGLRDDMEVGFTAMRLQNDRRFLDHERRLRELEESRRVP